jgi:hypothetical protein
MLLIQVYGQAKIIGTEGLTLNLQAIAMINGTCFSQGPGVTKDMNWM